MKKLLVLFFVLLGMTLTSCSCFDSAPINPKIIGSGNLQYDVKSGLCYVVIDTTQYTVAQITIPDHNPRSMSITQDIQPVEGMLVTLFTAEHRTGIQAVAGKQSVLQIEELYHENKTGLIILMSIFVLGIICFGFSSTKKIGVVQTNRQSKKK